MLSETFEVGVQSAQLVVYLNNGLPTILVWAYAIFLSANCVVMAATHSVLHKLHHRYPWADEYISLV